MVDVVIDKKVKRTFTTHTNITWGDFVSEVHQRINNPPNELVLGYRIGSESAMSTLACEAEWKVALTRLKEKVCNARRRAVSMEIKNLVSCASAASLEYIKIRTHEFY